MRPFLFFLRDFLISKNCVFSNDDGSSLLIKFQGDLYPGRLGFPGLNLPDQHENDLSGWQDFARECDLDGACLRDPRILRNLTRVVKSTSPRPRYDSPRPAWMSF